jgi:hypothetical protein
MRGDLNVQLIPTPVYWVPREGRWEGSGSEAVAETVFDLESIADGGGAIFCVAPDDSCSSQMAFDAAANDYTLVDSSPLTETASAQMAVEGVDDDYTLVDSGSMTETTAAQMAVESVDDDFTLVDCDPPDDSALALMDSPTAAYGP